MKSTGPPKQNPSISDPNRATSSSLSLASSITDVPKLTMVGEPDSLGDTSTGTSKGDEGPRMGEVSVPHDSEKTVTLCEASTSVVPTKSGNGSLWDQFAKTHNLSTQKESSSLSLAGSSDDEVWMPEVMPGAGFLDELKSYDGYDYDFPAHGFESRPKGRHKY
ncbi:hypothetical protein CTI12_AA377030 [Artemisia annua]|uniref:Uncharacterized protein n=1 Tax=Artemisia annua TaxID=35608 RepID=A0A2U1MBM2_ARTAN|nr:hypothetical protein CTI12_AA377030 [Artemisia annua]